MGVLPIEGTDGEGLVAQLVGIDERLSVTIAVIGIQGEE